MASDHRYKTYQLQDTLCQSAALDTFCIVQVMEWYDLAKQKMDALGITQEDLAEKFAVTRGAVGHWLNGRREPSPSQLRQIAQAINIPLDELLQSGLSGNGNVEAGPRIRGEVPLISWVAAGNFEPTQDPYSPNDAESWFPCPVSHSKYTYALRVRGDSMSPEYKDGEIIFVDPMLDPRHGDDVIVRLIDSDETTFKQYRREGNRAYLIPLNPDWPDKIIEVNERASFKGVVIFSGKRRR